MSSDPDLIIKKQGASAHITLARPRALHALTADMCDVIRDSLIAWQGDDGVAQVLITAAPREDGRKIFCAGGDVRLLTEMITAGEMRAADAYLGSEYQADMMLAKSRKPVVVIADGLTMGGGSGLLLNARHAIATTAMDFAMPECAIGLFPDVAASLFLRRAPLAMAVFLGVLGWRIGAGDMRRLGIVPRVIDTARAGEVSAAVLGHAGDAESLTALLDGFSIAPDDATAMQSMPSLIPHRDWIENHFGDASRNPAVIRAGLEGDTHPLAEEVRHRLDTRCPVSMWLTHRMLTDPAIRPADTTAALQLDHRLATRMIRRPDFAEGVRATLLDKDNNPQWQPARITEVTDAMIDAIITEKDAVPLAVPAATQ